MNGRKKIISIVIKSLIGIACIAIVYFRLKNDFTPSTLTLLSDSFFSFTGILSLIACVLLIPLNWGIESYKWKLITAPVEKISFATAQKSVYSGVCLGNLAPGRATEFVARIIFFKKENRANITVLHFVGGMFQLSVTYLAGFIALAYKLQSFGDEYMWIAYTTSAIAITILCVFVLSIIKIDKVLEWASKKISKQHQVSDFKYRFTRTLLLQLSGLSALRYIVFFIQMLLLLNLFFTGPFTPSVFLSVSLYYLITTTIPMISIIEPAIRAAVALVVFKDTGISNASLALASVSVWLLNIILPTVAGYVFLLKQNFDFNLRSGK